MALYDPILNEVDYLIQGANRSNQIVLGALFELILVSTAVGTGITLFPYLKKQNEMMALGYFCFRMLEAIFIMIGIVSILSLLSLSQTFVVDNSNIESYEIVAHALKASHKWTFMLGPNFMLGINTFIYSFVLFHSRLIPKKFGFLGMTSAFMIFSAALLEMFGIIEQLSTIGVLLAFPIFIYEMSLALWLIIKGFSIRSLPNDI